MEEAIRQSLGIGFLKRQWAITGHLTEEQAMSIALEAQREVRAQKRSRG